MEAIETMEIIPERKTKKKKEREKMGKIAGFLYYTNPAKVSAEIERYGYTYTWMNTVGSYLTVLLVCLTIGYFYELYLPCIAAIAIFGVLVVPRIVLRSYMGMYQQKRYSAVNQYIEQMLYSFKSKPNILSSLENTIVLFEDQEMKDTLQAAIDCIKTDYKASNPTEKALELIENAYKSKKVKNMHRLLLNIEKIGGSFDSSVNLLIKDRQIWDAQKCQTQLEAKKNTRMVNVAIILVLLFGAITPVFAKIMPQISDMLESPMYQGASTAFAISMLLLYTKFQSGKNIDWLDNVKSKKKEKRIIEQYNLAIDPNKGKDLKKMLMFVIPSIVLAVGFYFLHIIVPVVIFGFVAIYNIFSPRMNYRTTRKIIYKEIGKAFPNWLMEVALLLQTENVQVAILKTIPDAEPVLKPALEKFEKEMNEDPTGKEPFFNFLSELNLPEVKNAMNMLYSIYNGAGGDSDKQIEGILDRNIAIIHSAEKLENEEKMGGYVGKLIIPMLIFSFKMIVDMMLILFSFFEITSTIV